MHHPKQLRTDQYTYHLPEDRIAQFPLAERDLSRMLVYKDYRISEDIFANISRHMPAGSLLVFNDTRVIHARILFRKPTGGVIEIFVLEPAAGEAVQVSSGTGAGTARWNCLIGGAGKWKKGQAMHKEIVLRNERVILTAAITGRQPGFFEVGFSWQPSGASFLQVLEQAGSVPVPPYLKREAGSADDERYQTVYARNEGSVAAPTAGLHFTQQVFNSLAAKNIEAGYLTLHVGAGTFMPVKSTLLEGHTMHAEWLQVDGAFLEQLLTCRGPVVAVGTTSLRTVESLYWMGCKAARQPGISADELAIGQWDPYDGLQSGNMDASAALAALLDWMKRHGSGKLAIKTQLLIAPPYRPRIAKALITNFHQPASTLLLLVAAVTGNRWKEMYDYAMEHDFRFLSYGDGSLIWFS